MRKDVRGNYIAGFRNSVTLNKITVLNKKKHTKSFANKVEV